MNYIELINNFWRVDDGAQFTGWETKLYFYLIKTANGLGWVNDFWHSDAKTSVNVGLSINTLKTSRNRLKQMGLIDFMIGGKGHGDKTRYQILIPKPQSTLIQKSETRDTDETRYQKLTPKPQPKDVEEVDNDVDKQSRYQNLTPNLEPNPYPNLQPKPQPNPYPLIKLNETKLKKTTTTTESDFFEIPEFVQEQRLAAENCKNQITAESLTETLLQNETCKMAAKNAGVKAEDFHKPVEKFVNDKFGLGGNLKWKDMGDALQHFVYWVKSYHQIIDKDGKSGNLRSTPKTGRNIVEQPGTDNSRLETDADGVVWRITPGGIKTIAG